MSSNVPVATGGAVTRSSSATRSLLDAMPCSSSRPSGSVRASAKAMRLSPGLRIGLTKRWVHETRGAIDWHATTADLFAKGIELRGANAEEAPGAYKRLDEVLAYHAGTVRVLHTLTPLGVAMASVDVRDPYKD